MNKNKEHCKHCKGRIYAICDFLHEDGAWTRIPVCKKHIAIGMYEQQSLAFQEQLKMRVEFWVKSLSYQNHEPLT